MDKSIISEIQNTFFYLTHINTVHYSSDVVTSYVNIDEVYGLTGYKSIIDEYRSSDDICTIITRNSFENYIVKSITIDNEKNLFLCGPYLTQMPSTKDIINLCKGIKVQHNENDVIKHFLSLPVVSINFYNSMVTLINSLVKINKDDISHKKTNTSKNDSNSANYTQIKSSAFESWKYDISLKSIQYNDEFYQNMFHAENINELHKVLTKYAFITEAFESLNETYDYGSLRATKTMALTSVAFTFKNATKFGLSSHTGINMLIHYDEEIENAATIREILNLQTEFLVEFYKATKKESSAYSNPIVNSVKNYISSNITENINLKDIAKSLGYNKEYLSSQFKKYTKVSVVSYINTKKVELAKNLLLTTSDKIYDISEYLGFGSISSFIRVFKSITGVSPSDFRKNPNIP